MIVIGVDVHKQSFTAVAVDEVGRMLDERTVPVGSDELIGWALALDAERLWAVEDCRQLTPWLERHLLAAARSWCGCSPKLMVPERRAGRKRGKSDPIDALAIARAAVREPDLQPAPSRRARPTGISSCWSITATISSTSADGCNSGCAGTCISSTRRSLSRCGARPRLAPRTRRPLACPSASRTSRCGSHASLSIRCRAMTQDDQRTRPRARTAGSAVAPALLEVPGCGALTAAKLLAEIGPVSRFKSDAQLARHSGVAPLQASSGKLQRHRLDRGGNRQLNAALYRIAITPSPLPPRRTRLPRTQTSRGQRAAAKRSAASL